MQRDDNAAFNLFRLNLWARHFLHPQNIEGRHQVLPHLPSPYAPPIPPPAPALPDGLGRPVFPGLSGVEGHRASMQLMFANGVGVPEVAGLQTISGNRHNASSPEAITSPESEESSDAEPCYYYL